MLTIQPIFQHTPILDALRLIAIAVWGANSIQALRIIIRYRRTIDRHRFVGWFCVGLITVIVLETEWDRFGHSLGIGGRLLLVLAAGAGYYYSSLGVVNPKPKIYICQQCAREMLVASSE
jgi:hypothetical protein